jgi:hypothetical protein
MKPNIAVGKIGYKLETAVVICWMHYVVVTIIAIEVNDIVKNKKSYVMQTTGIFIIILVPLAPTFGLILCGQTPNSTVLCCYVIHSIESPI